VYKRFSNDRWSGGYHEAADRLARRRSSRAGTIDTVVYDELRRLARRHMAHERVGHTLQATALVNEAFVRLIDVRQVKWQDRLAQARRP